MALLIFASKRPIFRTKNDKSKSENTTVILHSRQHMAVPVQCDANAGMAQSLLGDLGGDATGQQMCGVAVPEIVQPYLRELVPAHELSKGAG